MNKPKVSILLLIVGKNAFVALSTYRKCLFLALFQQGVEEFGSCKVSDIRVSNQDIVSVVHWSEDNAQITALHDANCVSIFDTGPCNANASIISVRLRFQSPRYQEILEFRVQL